jgi:hypothetical protein
MLQTIIDNKHILAGWMDEGKIFYYSWKGFVPSAEMKRLLEEILIHLETKRAFLMLQNLQHTQAVTAEFQEWYATSWLPRACDRGLYRVALLTPRSIFGQLAVNKVAEKFRLYNSAYVESASFDDETQAIQWLKYGEQV